MNYVILPYNKNSPKYRFKCIPSLPTIRTMKLGSQPIALPFFHIGIFSHRFNTVVTPPVDSRAAPTTNTLCFINTSSINCLNLIFSLLITFCDFVPNNCSFSASTFAVSSSPSFDYDWHSDTGQSAYNIPYLYLKAMKNLPFAR